MLKSRIIAFLTVLAALISCGGPAVEKHEPSLLDFVPSDALAVVSYDRCMDGLELLDTANVLHKIDYGKLGNSKAVLALCYTTSLMPILAIDTGKAAADTSDAVTGIIGQAAELGLKAEFIQDEEQTGKRGALVITPSQTELISTKRHYSEQASILDASGFQEALDKCNGSKEWIIFRSNGADKYIPRSFLMNYVPRREFSLFMQKATDWMVLVPSSGSSFTADAVCAEFGSYYFKTIESLPATQSKLGPMLPRSTEFAIALPTPKDRFREAYEVYLDASVKLEKYEARLRDLKTDSGKAPKDWEEELDVREVAVVKWNNRSVNLVRCGKSRQQDIAPNPYRGFVAALYGSAFAINDDSSYACSGGWMIFGGEEDLEAFLNCEHGVEGTKWPGKDCKAIVFKPGFLFCWNKKEITLNVNRPR